MIGRSLKTITAILLTLTALTPISCKKGSDCTLNMLVGTYTGASGSCGVYLYSFNPKDCRTVLLDSAAALNPSFIIPSADRRFAYSVSEYEDGTQGVYSYRLGPGSIEVLNKADGCGGSPCNIAIAGNNIVTSDYVGGTLSVFPLKADGTVGEKSFSFAPAHDNSGTVSHIHCATLSPDGRYLFITDLGADAIYRADIGGEIPKNFIEVFNFDQCHPGLDPGSLTSGDAGSKSGMTQDRHPGPRHLTFSPDGRFAYLISEKGDCVSSFSFNNGNLTLLETRLAYDGEGHGSGDIHLTPNGRFLYTSHRLKADGIAVFERDSSTGLLKKTGYCPTGKHPRNFAITPDGTLLLCACRDDNRIEVYSIDPDTGELSFTGKTIPVPAPVCIQLF